MAQVLTRHNGCKETQDEGAVELAGYADLLVDLTHRVRQTQFRAARAVNAEVLRLYWSIGRDILDRQQSAGWDSKVVDMLAADLKREFPDQRGWSRRNLLYMRRAGQAWPTESDFVQQAAAQLSWPWRVRAPEDLNAAARAEAEGRDLSALVREAVQASLAAN